jgi:hypothetical protein
VILSCPTCRQRSRHPPNQMLGRWAICPHCGGEIDWRELTPVGDLSAPNDELFPLPDTHEENER